MSIEMETNVWTDFVSAATAILAACVIADYAVLLLMLPLGGRPDFANTTNLAINVSVTALFLLVGWATRRVVLVTAIVVGFGLLYIVPNLFALRGTLSQQLMQLITYLGLPLFSAGSFILLCKASGIDYSRRKRSPKSK